MQRQPNQGLDAASRRLLLWIAMPIALIMAYFAYKGTAVSFPTRRSGGSTPFTWEESPLGFILYGVMAYGVTCCIVLICRPFAQFFIDEFRLRRRRDRW